jgi:hypothetical protein
MKFSLKKFLLSLKEGNLNKSVQFGGLLAKEDFTH